MKLSARAWLAIAFLLILPEAWLASASAIYCGITHNMPLWTFPYWQWVEVFSRRREMYYRPSPWYAVLSHPLWGLFWGAALPSLITILVLATLIVTRRKTTPSVYGNSARATIKEMLVAGFRLHRKPFW